MLRPPYCGWLFAAVAAVAVAGPATAADDSVRTVRTVTRTVSVTATVDALDVNNRIVTLREPDGHAVTVKVGERVRNLPQVHVGDQVVVKYHETAAIRLRKAPMEPTATMMEGTSTARPGEKPGGTGVRQITVVAPIMAIDTKKPSVTLRGADGNLIEAAVQDRNNLKGVNVGDNVEITYTEALAISVASPQ